METAFANPSKHHQKHENTFIKHQKHEKLLKTNINMKTPKIIFFLTLKLQKINQNLILPNLILTTLGR